MLLTLVLGELWLLYGLYQLINFSKIIYALVGLYCTLLPVEMVFIFPLHLQFHYRTLHSCILYVYLATNIKHIIRMPETKQFPAASYHKVSSISIIIALIKTRQEIKIIIFNKHQQIFFQSNLLRQKLNKH